MIYGDQEGIDYGFIFIIITIIMCLLMFFIDNISFSEYNISSSVYYVFMFVVGVFGAIVFCGVGICFIFCILIGSF
jgi:hypothetical protein